MNILLPTDFSDNAWNALEYALGYFQFTSCTFHLLHVDHQYGFSGGNMAYYPSHNLVEKSISGSTKHTLHELLPKIKANPLSSKHQFVTANEQGSLVDVLRSYTKRNNISMIVMGTKGASGLKKLIVGSNTANVITKVPCDTLIVPEQASFKPLDEIAFPTDFSVQYNLSILQTISNMVKTYHASLSVLHISKSKTELNNEQLRSKALLGDIFDDLPHNFYFLTNPHVEEAVECFVESRNIDIIVMVAKNLNYFQKLLFQPVVERISYHTTIPFLVLHESK
ncbi:universal stress protein [Mangrovimonas aestuarii]|uniref:universal stress protein n=1 Tax=Mangrovimonas aestuarii TaxID=3018443 RepID=UPI0023788B61|nr:universal stress protein [Mangrovimonas aestuarii]